MVSQQDALASSARGSQCLWISPPSTAVNTWLISSKARSEAHQGRPERSGCRRNVRRLFEFPPRAANGESRMPASRNCRRRCASQSPRRVAFLAEETATALESSPRSRSANNRIRHFLDALSFHSKRAQHAVRGKRLNSPSASWHTSERAALAACAHPLTPSTVFPGSKPPATCATRFCAIPIA
jgi:hypothetical protein